MKLLIAEDNEFTVLLYKKIFSNQDITITQTGDLFMGKYSKNYDILIIDIRLPERDGFELISFLEAVNNQIPTLVITSISFEDFKKEIKNFDKYYFSQKPIDIKQLKATIENINTLNHA